MRALDITTPGERVPVSCVVDPTLKRALQARARANDRTLSAELRTAIRHHLNNHEQRTQTMNANEEPAANEPVYPWQDPNEPLQVPIATDNTPDRPIPVPRGSGDGDGALYSPSEDSE